MNADKGQSSTMLVSFIVVAYNQEQFIREAVRSALAQTYSPLQIVLSDDASVDRSFEIMQEEVAAYHGPHEILLNRNPSNLGLARHLNRVAELASGELLVMQGGDDVSRPERTARLVEAYLEPTPVDMVCSDVVWVDIARKPLPKQLDMRPVSPLVLEEAIAKGYIGTLGCAAAYSKSLWTKYGEIGPKVLQEDVVLPFRAMLERGVRVVDDRLVEYRIHDGGLYSGRGDMKSRKTRQRWAENDVAISDDWLASWKRSAHHDPKLERQLRYRAKQRAYDADCYQHSRGYALLAAVRGLFDGLSLKNAAGLVRRHVLHLL